MTEGSRSASSVDEETSIQTTINTLQSDVVFKVYEPSDDGKK